MSFVNSDLPIELLQLQTDYAMHAVAIASIGLEKALMSYTQCWTALCKENSHDYAFDPKRPNWVEFIRKVNNGANIAATAFEMSKGRNDPGVFGKRYFGCFRYDWNPTYGDQTGVVKIHFKNYDQSGIGPFAVSNVDQRQSELRDLFLNVREEHPEAQVVNGGSWLYNTEGYRRLFPESFLTNPVTKYPIQPTTSGIWGQFISSRGGINNPRVERFRERFQVAISIEQLLDAFEYKILLTRAPIEDFYELYGINCI